MLKESKIKWIINKNKQINIKEAPIFLSEKEIQAVKQFFTGIASYKPTPLLHLDNLSKQWGLRGIYIKDESHRFELNAFKALGSLYAMASVICDRIGTKPSETTFEALVSDDMKEKIGSLLFVSATDGNHGRGVAWAARKLGHKAMIFMPKGSSLYRLKMIQDEGAQASITDLNYDDAVRYAYKYAQENGGVLIQDTAWEGYEEIPARIMQGYAVIMDEVIDVFQKSEKLFPTHIFLQAGVGSFAGAIQGYLVERFGVNCPITVVLEPKNVNCHYRTAQANDGKIHSVKGDFHTIMAGLSCGEPNPVAWGILQQHASAFVSCADSVSATGMRILASPLRGDHAVISGESGALGMGFLAKLMHASTKEEKSLAKELRLTKDSRILLISTEGDTDPEQYQRIVWEGAYSSVLSD